MSTQLAKVNFTINLALPCFGHFPDN